MVILSHILSRTSSPESGLAIARTTTGISVRTLKCISSIVPTQIKSTFENQTLLSNLLWSQSGMLEVMDELVDVSVLTDGGLRGKSPVNNIE
jgi:hypothetical protein